MRGDDAATDRIIENVGRRIAELRHQRGWTQRETAEKLRIEEQSLQRFERGANLTLRTLVKLAKIFGVEPQALFDAARPQDRRPGRPRKAPAPGPAVEPRHESSRSRAATRSGRQP
jgi:transcriptional regulator with XRE-family HTH domain